MRPLSGCAVASFDETLGLRPLFGVVVCCGVPCCVVPCSDVLRRVCRCCVAVRRAGPRRVAPCLAVVCRSVPRRVASCCGVLCFGVPCRVALHSGAVRCGVACCLLLCRGGLVDVSLAYVLVRSAGWSVAGWRLGGVVRCGWLAGSVLRGSECAAWAGGSVRCPWGCPPLGLVPWSPVLWGFPSLALGAVAVPLSSFGACEVALAVAGVVAWRLGRGGELRGGVPSGFPRWCTPFSSCRCALHPLCGFQWLVGVCWCDPYGFRFVLRRRVFGACAPGGRAGSAGGGEALVTRSWYALSACGSWCPP